MKIFRSGMANMTPNPATQAGNLTPIDNSKGKSKAWLSVKIGFIPDR